MKDACARAAECKGGHHDDADNAVASIHSKWLNHVGPINLNTVTLYDVRRKNIDEVNIVYHTSKGVSGPFCASGRIVRLHGSVRVRNIVA
jgi:hypothetical protein